MLNRFWLGVALALGATSQAAPSVPYGHADFLPTPDQPLGYRGDGSGVYPGATPPLHFDEQSGRNLRWAVKIPKVWSHSPPVVVGQKVIIEAEPDTTLCVDADTGRIVWQDSLGLLATPTGGWDLHSGNGYSTASSDGAAVYRLFSGRPVDAARKGNSLLVSYDLDGKRRWLVQTTGMGNLQAPLLIGGRLVAIRRSGPRVSPLVAYDTASGRVSWEATGCDMDKDEPNPWGAGDGCLVRVRLNARDLLLNPGAWCIDPQTGKRLARTLPMQVANGRRYHPMGASAGNFSTPVVRHNDDGSATVLFCGDDPKGLVYGEEKGPLVYVPPDADTTAEPWASKRTRWAVRVLACRLSVDGDGQIRSQPLWKQPASVQMETSGGMWPHLALCGDRVAVLNVKGQIAVLDLKTGRLLGKDFQPIYACEYKTAVSKYKWDTPELIAAREEYALTEEVAFGKGGGRNMETSLARMARTAYARSAVDSRNYLWLAHRWGEFYVLELTDEGFRQVAHNRVNHPICWCSHAAPVFHGNRLYYRTWGHLYCFDNAGGPSAPEKASAP
jgi:outer membrane protein assembly factor BamB